jgi:hypothetical protein
MKRNGFFPTSGRAEGVLETTAPPDRHAFVMNRRRVASKE